MIRSDSQSSPVFEQASSGQQKQLADTVAQHLHTDLIARQLPSWFKKAPTQLRETLRQTMQQWHATQTEVAATFAQVQPIEKFVEPLLRAALAARGWSDIDPKFYGLKHVRLMNNSIVFIANQQLKLVDTLVRQVLPDTMIPESLELNLVSSIGEYSLLQAALQNFESKETQADGFDQGTVIFSHQNHQRSEHPELQPETFASICRDLDLGEQYQAHLNNVFNPPDDEFPVSDPRSKVHQLNVSFRSNKCYEFMAELHMAFMKKQISNANYNAIRRGVSPAEGEHKATLQHCTLEIMGFEVPGAIVLWPDQQPSEQASPCVVYLPQCPDQVFFQFPNFYEFKNFLLTWLRRPVFARYFVSLVPLRYRAEFIRRTDIKNKTWDSLLLHRPPIINQPAIISTTRYIPQTDDPFAVAWRLHLAQIKDDARLLVVPTADENVKSRLERQAAYFNAGLSVMALALGFVPVLGEVMLAFGVIQVGADIYHGIGAWQCNERVDALNYLFDVAENVALVAAPGAIKVMKPASVVDGLAQVTLENGKKKLWRPELTSYQYQPELLTGIEPDAQGIYTRDNKEFIRIDGEVYRVRVDRMTGLGTIEHPNDPSAYKPNLRGNTCGGWIHELENPTQWSRLQLFQRLGPEAELLPAEAAERILQITGTTEAVLRRVHMDHLAVPPLLADCIKRVRLNDQVAAFIVGTKAGVYARPEFAPMQLDLLTQLPGWPSDRVLRVVDMQGVIVNEYGHSLVTPGGRLQIAETQVNDGNLLKVTLDQLSQAQIDQLLGESVTGQEQQLQALARKLGGVTNGQSQLISRLYTRSETLKPEFINMSKQFPSLPVGVIEELAAHLTSKELQNLISEGRTPLHILEEARSYIQTLRVNRAIEGIYYAALSSADSNTVAWKTLPLLEGWPASRRLVLRDKATNQVLDSLGSVTTAHSSELIKDGEFYEFQSAAEEPIERSSHILEGVLQVLSSSDRSALGVETIQPYADLRFKVANVAAQQRSEVANILGLHTIKPWFKSPLRLADGRLGYTLGGRAGHVLLEPQPQRFKDLVATLYPLMSDAQVELFLSRLGLSSELISRRLVSLKAELDTLRRDLDGWVASTVWSQPRSGLRTQLSIKTKQAISQALLSAWRRQTPSLNVHGHTGYELNLGALPVDSLPVLSADFGHVSALYLSNSPNGKFPSVFLRKFTNLRVLSIKSSQLATLPSELAHMSELIHLNLQGNGIALSNETALLLSSLTKLRSLNLAGNVLGARISVRLMPELKHLLLRYTGITEWPDGVETLNGLQTLDLRDNAIRTIPAHILAPARATINRVTFLHDNPLNFDSLRRLEAYRREHGINLGIDPQRQHVAPRRGIFHWAWNPTQLQSRIWNELQGLQGADDFFRVLEDLSTSSQYSRHIADLIQRVWALLGAMHTQIEMCDRMFEIAANPRTCADGIAMIFADMELHHLVFLAYSNPNTEGGLLKLAQGLFRIDLLNQYVLSVIEARMEAIKAQQLGFVQRLQILIDEVRADFAPSPLIEMDAEEQQGVAYRLGTPEALYLAEVLSPESVRRQMAELDPLEVQMFFHVKLGNELGLPARPTSMHFERIAKVTSAELEAAKQYVLSQDTLAGRIVSIGQRDFWKEFLQMKYPEEFKASDSIQDERMDALYTARESISSHEYVSQSNSLVELREQARAQLINRLTQQELERASESRI